MSARVTRRNQAHSKSAYRLGIVGSRNFPELEKVKEFVDSRPHGWEFVTGDARGVDNVVLEQCIKQGYACTVFSASGPLRFIEAGIQVIVASNWAEHGKQAGPIRNSALVKYVNNVVAFWDMRSLGAFDTIAKAYRVGKLGHIMLPGKGWLELHGTKTRDRWGRRKCTVCGEHYDTWGIVTCNNCRPDESAKKRSPTAPCMCSHEESLKDKAGNWMAYPDGSFHRDDCPRAPEAKPRPEKDGW